MRLLFDIVHPAHVHFYRHMLTELSDRGHEWVIASRDKDVTNALLDRMELPYRSVSTAGTSGGLALELARRDLALVRLARDFRPDLILTRNPSGTHVGRVLGIPTVFDTDNGKSAGVHYWAAAPFASVMTTPDCFPDELGRKQVRYPSYKPLAFLHPKRFQPDPDVKQRLGVGSSPYYVIRLVAMAASHDRGESGMPMDTLMKVIDVLSERGRVFISSEAPLSPQLSHLALTTPPHDFHHVLSGATLTIGDSGSVVQESAVLGVPAVFVSSFAGRTPPIDELEHRYRLVRSFVPTDTDAIVRTVESGVVGSEDERRQRWSEMLSDKVDLTSWYLDFIDRVVLSRPKAEQPR